MKKVFLTLFAAAVSVAAIAQTDFWVWKNGVAMKTTQADSITFADPIFADQYHDGSEAGYNYVDLGLTSGTRWATMNVGASKTQDYGNYYAWGEVTTKETYSWSTYLGGNMSSESDCGTNNDALKGVTDIAGTQYDAAKANWGGKWCMPTKAQQDELRNECYWVWTENYNNLNVAGYIVYKAKTSNDKGLRITSSGTPSSSYSLGDAHIFLPAAGYRVFDGFYNRGAYGCYWSSSLIDDYQKNCASNFGFNSGDLFLPNDRYYGRTVRPVCK